VEIKLWWTTFAVTCQCSGIYTGTTAIVEVRKYVAGIWRVPLQFHKDVLIWHIALLPLSAPPPPRCSFVNLKDLCASYIQMNITCFNHTILSALTASGHPAWVPDSSCRGTFRIISLCVSTTVISIWSSIHKDIPLHCLSTFPSIVRDAPLALVALFCPELLVYYALYQLLWARKLVHKARATEGLKAASPDDEKGKNAGFLWAKKLVHKVVGFKVASPDGEKGKNMATGRRHPFSYVHGFYATMGGFALSLVDENGTPNDRNRARLTAKGVHYLMQHAPEVIPDLSETSITDRAKSGSLGKAVWLFQLVSFGANCASRINEKLPLTLLEVSTLAHGVCTVVLCGIWWYKPLDIEEPTWITINTFNDGRAREILAHMQDMDAGQQEEFDRVHSSRLNFRAFKAEKSRKKINQAETYFRFRHSPTLNDLLWADSNAVDLGKFYDYLFVVSFPIIYGAVHLLGWKANFPMIVERNMWHLATVDVMSLGAAFVISYFLYTCLHGFFRFLFFIIICAIPIAYFLSSLYLFGESIRQLLYLPPGAFVVAPLSIYFPSFS